MQVLSYINIAPQHTPLELAQDAPLTEICDCAKCWCLLQICHTKQFASMHGNFLRRSQSREHHLESAAEAN